MTHLTRVTHDLKVWPAYFEDIRSGLKTFEYRYDDRDYETGDTLLLREYDPVLGGFTGKMLRATVGFILSGSMPMPTRVIPPPHGMVILSLIDVR